MANILTEDKIFEILQNSSISSIHNSDSLDKNQIKLFNNYYSSLSKEVSYDIFEIALTDKKIQEWINVLYFQKNLDMAIEALDSYDDLESRELELLSYDTDNCFYDSIFKVDADFKKKRDNLIKNSKLEDIRSTLNYRKTKKLFDVIDYSKAVKIGGEILFDIKKSDYESDEKYVSKIREELREILRIYQIKLGKQQTATISTSLNFTKDKNGQWISSMSKEDATRGKLNTQITDNYFEFDISTLDILTRIPKHRLLKVGIEVVDNIGISAEATRLSEYTPYWNFDLSDKNNGVEISINNTHQIKDTLFTGVQGGRDSRIIWSNNESLINVNFDRKWGITILGCNIDNPKIQKKDRFQVLDIVLHFHVVYEK